MFYFIYLFDVLNTFEAFVIILLFVEVSHQQSESVYSAENTLKYLSPVLCLAFMFPFHHCSFMIVLNCPERACQAPPASYGQWQATQALVIDSDGLEIAF